MIGYLAGRKYDRGNDRLGGTTERVCATTSDAIIRAGLAQLRSRFRSLASGPLTQCHESAETSFEFRLASKE